MAQPAAAARRNLRRPPRRRRCQPRRKPAMWKKPRDARGTCPIWTPTRSQHAVSIWGAISPAFLVVAAADSLQACIHRVQLVQLRHPQHLPRQLMRALPKKKEKKNSNAMEGKTSWTMTPSRSAPLPRMTAKTTIPFLAAAITKTNPQNSNPPPTKTNSQSSNPLPSSPSLTKPPGIRNRSSKPSSGTAHPTRSSTTTSPAARSTRRATFLRPSGSTCAPRSMQARASAS
mmetsp:Transcript_160/g.375  ORF Transcript_160/g.375 Transcript_160/m.375 type:complete len:230 (-) Transcript_160:1358-2047(-)